MSDKKKIMKNWIQERHETIKKRCPKKNLKDNTREYAKKACKKKFKKSLDWRNTGTMVDSNDQKLAEETASKELISYLKALLRNDINKIPLAKGTLTVHKRGENLFSGFYQDEYGQVAEKFDDVTVQLLAKNLEIKDLYEAPKVEPAPKATGGAMRLKYGDLEIEIKKSINFFINDFKATKKYKKTDIKKAISSWRRNSANHIKNDFEAAKELSSNWNEHKESFHQVLFAIEQMKKRNGK